MIHSFSKRYIFKVLHVPIRLIYETNRKLTKFVMRAPVGSTISVPLEIGDKAREEFLKANESFIVTLYIHRK
jgi:hypothetical protein